jgi:ABC-2 type transport system permease protein
MRRWCTSYLLLVRWTAIRLRYLLPMVLVTQALMAVGIVIGFSFLPPSVDPGTAPADRLPGWLQAVHEVLPFEYLAEVVRDTLATPATGVDPLPFGVLAIWCTAGLAVTLRVMTRRS